MNVASDLSAGAVKGQSLVEASLSKPVVSESVGTSGRVRPPRMSC